MHFSQLSAFPLKILMISAQNSFDRSAPLMNWEKVKIIENWWVWRIRKILSTFINLQQDKKINLHHSLFCFHEWYFKQTAGLQVWGRILAMPVEGGCGNFLESLAHERVCMYMCMRPIIHSHSQLQRLGFKSVDVDRVYTETKNWVFRGDSSWIWTGLVLAGLI